MGGQKHAAIELEVVVTWRLARIERHYERGCDILLSGIKELLGLLGDGLSDGFEDALLLAVILDFRFRLFMNRRGSLLRDVRLLDPGRDQEFLLAGNGGRRQSVGSHDGFLAHAILPGDGIEVFIPLDGMDDIVAALRGGSGGRLRSRSGLRNLGGLLRGNTVRYWDEKDLVGLQALGLELEGGIGVIYVLDGHAVGLGDGEQCLPLEHYVRVIQLAVVAHPVPGDGDGRSLVLRILRTHGKRGTEDKRGGQE